MAKSRTKRTRKKRVGGELHGPRLERWKFGAIHRASFSVSALSNHGYPGNKRSSERVAAEQQSLPRGSDLDKAEAPLYAKGMYSIYASDEIHRTPNVSSEEELIKTSASFEHISVSNQFFRLHLNSNVVYCFSRFSSD